MSTPTITRHGTTRSYRAGCGCPECTEAGVTFLAQRRARQKRSRERLRADPARHAAYLERHRNYPSRIGQMETTAIEQGIARGESHARIAEKVGTTERRVRIVAARMDEAAR